MRAALVILLIGLATCLSNDAASAWAESGDKLKLGDKAPSFAELPGTDGEQHSSADFDKAKVLVVVFTCNSCPYAVDYEDRLIEFHQQYVRGNEAALVAINCNLVPQDSLEKMTKRAEEKGFPFPYLFDESQDVARSFGALRTPECFVFNAKRELVYNGAFDDSPKAENVKQKYVETAVVDTLLGNATKVTSAMPVGCMIRFKPKRD